MDLLCSALIGVKVKFAILVTEPPLWEGTTQRYWLWTLFVLQKLGNMYLLPTKKLVFSRDAIRFPCENSE